MTRKRDDIAILGMGFVGLTLGTVLAEAGYKVVGYDLREGLAAAINAGDSPFHERGLPEALSAVVGGGFLRCTADPEDCAAETYIVSVGTPVDERNAPVVRPLEQACAHVGRMLVPGNLVILRSTVPPGATRGLALPILETNSRLRAGTDFDLAFAPERTVEGNALSELRTLPQIVGGLTAQSAARTIGIFSRISPRIIEVSSLETAEIVKMIDNTYRDCRFAYANEIAAICETCGADAIEAIGAANRDYARNSVPMPSPGVGGPCLTKDPYLLSSAARQGGYAPLLIEASRRVNEEAAARIARRLHANLRALGKSPERSRIFVMGFAFKGVPATTDTRGSCAVTLVRELVALGYQVRGHDHVAPHAAIIQAGAEPCEVEQGFAGADAAVIMNNHPEYARLRPSRLAATMRAPAIFFDGWRAFDRAHIELPPGVFYLGTGYDQPLPAAYLAPVPTKDLAA
jgi:UDP-N-acetyl-D-mannosaminuronic acid dehydrogenase